ncbi:hypothetical protein C9F11_10115 [Streptomyces sp. YIM 121038]|uniref:hypothetical protein n=1 Tax=Streptomyces sp. YIM 121038 TaxID=2136401 RepID=UPI00116331C2|nr:hypothetical protein [Streptomyces sp. YIM 121038]QCX75703.1 hypothetical protein C9F11_10115 [Streptomyces sp. YIM 121038]
MTYDEHQDQAAEHLASAPGPSRARAKRDWHQEALFELEDLGDLDAYEGLPEVRL